MIREGEFVQIVCQPAYPFEVSALKNPDVGPVPGAPTDPFGWNGAPPVGGCRRQPDCGGHYPHPSIPVGIQRSPGPRDQGFYKFGAVVRVGAQTVRVDPDGYCDRSVSLRVAEALCG